MLLGMQGQVHPWTLNTGVGWKYELYVVMYPVNIHNCVIHPLFILPTQRTPSAYQLHKYLSAIILNLLEFCTKWRTPSAYQPQKPLPKVYLSAIICTYGCLAWSKNIANLTLYVSEGHPPKNAYQPQNLLKVWSSAIIAHIVLLEKTIGMLGQLTNVSVKSFWNVYNYLSDKSVIIIINIFCW